MDLSRDEINELIRCATNKIGVIYPQTKAREDVAALLVAKGLMGTRPDDIYNLSHYPTVKPSLRRGAKVWLTDEGKQAILNLRPEDFKVNTWWPWPSDIEYAQKRVEQF